MGHPSAAEPLVGVDDGAEDVADDVAITAEFEARGQTLTASQHGQRLDHALTLLVPEFSRNHLQGLIVQGHVQLNGDPVTQASKRVKVGQRLAVSLVPPAESLAYRPEAMRLDIVHEDEHVLVVNKPAGLVVHPGRRQLVGHFAQRLAGAGSRCGPSAPGGHRAPAGQGHVGIDGRRPHAGGGDGAGPGHG